MGIFNINKKEDKIYSLKDAMKLLQTSKYQNYTTIPVGDGYKLVPMHPLVIKQEEISFINTKRNNFLNRMTKGVESQEVNKVPNYNNYQASKGYKQSQGISR